MTLRTLVFIMSYLPLLISISSSLPPPLPPLPPLQVIFVFGFIQDHVFCAVHNNEVKYLPSKASDIGLWFGVTAYLFCTHCVVRHDTCMNCRFNLLVM